MKNLIGAEALSSAPRILADTVLTSSIFKGGTSPLALARRAPIRQEMEMLHQELRWEPAPLPTEAKTECQHHTKANKLKRGFCPVEESAHVKKQWHDKAAKGQAAEEGGLRDRAPRYT